MAAFYVDHDVAFDLAYLLLASGHDVVTVRNLRTERHPDSHHLLTAALDWRILVTRNRHDFALLHDAWVRWSQAWGVEPAHAGILILPHVRPRQSYTAIVNLLESDDDIVNSLYEWDRSVGWLKTI